MKMETQEQTAERRRQWLDGAPGVFLTESDLKSLERHRDEQASKRPKTDIVVGKSNIGRTYSHAEAKANGALPNSVERYDVATGQWVPAEG